MQLTVRRHKSKDGATLGELFVNGKFECYTVEDEIREVKGLTVQQYKVPGKTAIPAGTYDVILSLSNRFKTVLPEILNVEGFTGVRIHPGNSAKDTEGCLLTGQLIDDKQMMVGKSVAAFNVLFLKLDAAWKGKDAITITYINE